MRYTRRSADLADKPSSLLIDLASSRLAEAPAAECSPLERAQPLLVSGKEP